MTHDERVYHHLYETLEGIAEQSERIASLEELVLDMNECVSRRREFGDDPCFMCPLYYEDERCDFNTRMAALGIRE